MAMPNRDNELRKDFVYGLTFLVTIFVSLFVYSMVV